MIDHWSLSGATLIPYSLAKYITKLNHVFNKLFLCVSTAQAQLPLFRTAKFRELGFNWD